MKLVKKHLLVLFYNVSVITINSYFSLMLTKWNIIVKCYHVFKENVIYVFLFFYVLLQ